MKKYLQLCWIFILVFRVNSFSQGEQFGSKRVVNANTASGKFRHPFAMVMGPDDSLWITERRGYVMKVSTIDGSRHQLLNIKSLVKFTANGNSIKQDGMFGIALHPELNTGTGNDYVFIAYCYDSSSLRRVKVVRYSYNRSIPSLSNPIVLLKGIHGSDDHNGGRLIIGNFGTSSTPDYKLLYSVGDRGANQFSNACDSIESQYIPSSSQVATGDISRYNGKILRLNLDGSIPFDNPVINGIRSHIYSYGHRNPQGLVFEKDDNNKLVPGGRLYESEQGPATDDEINIIEAGKNYGWPRVAGMYDNGWYRYYKWGGTSGCSSYNSECSIAQSTSSLTETSFYSTDYKNPIFDLYPGTPAGGTNCNWLTNPTIAPSSIIQYPFINVIPGWRNSLLITTLKSSAVYRLKLNTAGDGALSVSDSVVEYFKEINALNRYRDIAISRDGLAIYLLTDSVGATSGPSSGQNGGITNPGSILEYRYTGPLLSLGNDPIYTFNPNIIFKIYPNPASEKIYVELKRNVAKPVFYILYDMLGRKVSTGKSITDKFYVNVEKLQPGIFTIKLFNGWNILLRTEKIIVR